MYVQTRQYRGRTLVQIAPEGWVGDPPLQFHVKHVSGLIDQLKAIDAEFNQPVRKRPAKKAAPKKAASAPVDTAPKEPTPAKTSKTKQSEPSKPEEPVVTAPPSTHQKPHKAKVEDPSVSDKFRL